MIFGQGHLSDLVAWGFNQADEGGDFGGFCAGVLELPTKG